MLHAGRGTTRSLVNARNQLDLKIHEINKTNKALQAEITERKRAEERLRVQHTVAQVLAEAATIEEVTPKIPRAVGECLGWDVGALWRVDREAEALRCVELWHKASIEIPEFERADWQFTFDPGLGLPGRVWSSLKPAYIPDVVPDKNLPRGPIAEREGLHAAIGFPILLGSEVLGVIEFFSREIRQPDQELLDMVATIGSQIGQFIERKRAEEALMRSKDYLAETQKLTHTGSWAWDPRTEQVLYCSEEMFRIYGLDPRSSLPSRENFRQQIHPEDRDWVKERFEGSLRKKIDTSAARYFSSPCPTCSPNKFRNWPFAILRRRTNLVAIGAKRTWPRRVMVARHKCLPLARVDVAKSRPGHGDELAVRIERVDRIFRIQDPARRHILMGYLFGAQAVGSDVSPDLVHRGTFDDGIASDAKEGKFHGGTFPIWRYVHLMRLKSYLTGVVKGLSLVSRTKTASSFAGSVLLALRLIEWIAPGGSDQLSPAR